MNDALTLPFFTAQGSSSYPPTPPFGDSYDSTYTNSQDEYFSNGYDLDTHDEQPAGLILDPIQNINPASRSNGLGPYPFPTPPASSHTTGPTYSNPPTTFNPSDASSSYMSGLFTDPASYLEVDVTRPHFGNAEAGPSTYSRQSSATDEFLNQPDDVGEEVDEPLVKHEDAGRALSGDEGSGENGQDGADMQGEEQMGDEDNEEPLYVNAKQYHRILKRRAARQRLEELNRLARSRKPYLHESRHRHACSRPRGKGGRFLTADEIEALRKEEAAKSGASTGDAGSEFSRQSTLA